jgi:thioredoxin 1
MLQFTSSAATAGIVIVACFPVLAQPPVFKDVSLSEAKRTAGDRLLLVDATADWCPPCKMMDRTTWVDDRVVEWLNTHAVAIQVDVDEEPDTARELGIRAMPTMIVFRNGREVDRTVGYRDPDQMLEWLKGVQEAGGAQAEAPADDQLQDELGLAAVGNPEERLQSARRLLEAGQYEQATDEYIWLWNNIPEEAPELAGVRTTLLPGEIARLVQEHEPAAERFAALREQTEERLRGKPTWPELHDWIVLNRRILGGDAAGREGDERIIAWADRIKDDEAGIQTLRRFGFEIADLFEQRGRIDLLGLLETNPLLQVETMWRRVEMVESPEGAGVFAMLDPAWDVENMEPEAFEDPALQDEIRQVARQRFLEESAKLYGSLLAASRRDEATAVAEFVIGRTPASIGMVELVRFAARHGLAQPQHVDWLEEVAAPAGDDDMARDLEQLRTEVLEQLERGTTIEIGPAPRPR